MKCRSCQEKLRSLFGDIPLQRSLACASEARAHITSLLSQQPHCATAAVLALHRVLQHFTTTQCMLSSGPDINSSATDLACSVNWCDKPVAGGAQAAEGEMLRMNNQVRFIRAVRARQLDLTRKAAVIEAQLDADGYDRLLPPKARKVRVILNLANEEAASCISVPGRELR